MYNYYKYKIMINVNTNLTRFTTWEKLSFHPI